MNRPVARLLGATLVAVTVPALAQTPVTDCAALADDALRLACYDRAAGRKAPIVNPATDAAAAGAAAAAAAAAAPAPSALDRRRAETSASLQDAQWFTLLAHRTNYALPVSYTRDPNWNRYEIFGDTDVLKNVEVKYQLSLKTPLWPNISETGISLWMAFTLQSWWQAYAGDEASAPFRETNYEPEFYASFPLNYSLLGVRFSALEAGFNHQSNGRTEPLSRSWNRGTARLIFEGQNYAGYFKTWFRVSEDEEDDNNPNIERYMGQAELALAYRWRQHTFAGILKNNLRSDNKSGLQLDWTFPLLPHLKGYVQGYTGYGENLIDGDRYVNRLGLGLMFSDWF